MTGNRYVILKQQQFADGDYSIVPIRYEDRFLIMQWRNEQLYHLRQAAPLTAEDQERYFTGTIRNIFNSEKPQQILFSYLEKDLCIGYGGLVHINWTDRHAEISFLMNTSLEKDEFEKHWLIYLSLIERTAFAELGLHKIYTYAFDLRPHLYPVLQKGGYREEARLKDHCLFEGSYKDVLIHTKFNPHA